jgi:hypothetical protein
MSLCAIAIGIKLSAVLLAGGYIVGGLLWPRNGNRVREVAPAVVVLLMGLFIYSSTTPEGGMGRTFDLFQLENVFGNMAERTGNLFRSYTQVFLRPVEFSELLGETSAPLLTVWSAATIAFVAPFALGMYRSFRRGEMRMQLLLALLFLLLVVAFSQMIGTSFFYVRVVLPVVPLMAPFFGIGFLSLTEILSNYFGDLRWAALLTLYLLASAGCLLGALALDARRTAEVNQPLWEALEDASTIVEENDIVPIPEPYTGWRTWHMRRRMTFFGDPSGGLSLDNVSRSGSALADLLAEAGVTHVWLDPWPTTDPEFRHSVRAEYLPPDMEQVIISFPDRLPVLARYQTEDALLLGVVVGDT